MILLTGAAGFIGSGMASHLNELGYHSLILVDDFTSTHKAPNYQSKIYTKLVERTQLFQWLHKTKPSLEAVIHLGARTDTTEFDVKIFDHLNLQYSKSLWNYCTQHQIPFLYASSAATYGDGKRGFVDDEKQIPQLKPLNPYGQSKQDFDQWVLTQTTAPPFWVGLKFFNVYGPNEYHKGRMASVIYHAYHQISTTKQMKLFRSHRTDFQDGEQKRDFIYVKDIVQILSFFLKKQQHSGIYNAGTGRARSFNDLVRSVFKSLDIPTQIHYIDIPNDIRDTYQYYTQADMQKLVNIGYNRAFISLEEGIKDYITSYLLRKQYY